MQLLEPTLNVRQKDDISNCLVKIMHRQQRSSEYLAEIVMKEVTRVGEF